jgi:hypothetical protein
MEVPILIWSPFGWQLRGGSHTRMFSMNALELPPLCDPPSGEPTHMGTSFTTFIKTPLNWNGLFASICHLEPATIHHTSHDRERILIFFFTICINLKC